MSTALTFTSAPIGQATIISSTSEATILSSNANHLRIYGIVVSYASAPPSSVTINFKLKDTSSTIAFQAATTTGAIPNSANVLTDIFGNTSFAAVFQKQKDSNGAPYFNVPAGWIITATLSAAAVSPSILVFGETYA